MDTSTLIAMPEVDLGSFAEATVLLTAITLGELAYGLGMGDPEEQDARARRLHVAVREFDILPFDVEEAKIYGALAR